MKIFEKRDILKAVGITLAFGATVALAAWSGPTAAPPGNNTPPPLNVGSVGQTKGGNLALNLDGTLANGLLVPFGKVGIGLSNPSTLLHIKVSPLAPATGQTALTIEGPTTGSADIWFTRGASNGWNGWYVGEESKPTINSRFYIWNDNLPTGTNKYAISIDESTNNVGINNPMAQTPLDVGGAVRVRGGPLANAPGAYFSWNQGVMQFVDNKAGTPISAFTFDKTSDNVTLTRLFNIFNDGRVGADKYCDLAGNNCSTPGGSGGSGGVTKIIAGTNVTISPTTGVGDVTVNSVPSTKTTIRSGASALNSPTTISCPAGYVVTGGGYNFTGTGGPNNRSYPNSTGTGWTCNLTSGGTCYAVCAQGTYTSTP